MGIFKGIWFTILSVQKLHPLHAKVIFVSPRNAGRGLESDRLQNLCPRFRAIPSLGLGLQNAFFR